MSKPGREGTIHLLTRSILFLSCTLMVGCPRNNDSPNRDETPPLVPDATTTPQRVSPRAQADVRAPAAANRYACNSADIWRTLDVKGLKDGALQTPVEGVRLPSPVWRPCDEQEYCQKLVFSGDQRILALGQHGNRLRIALAERCGGSTSITIGGPDSPPTLALRGLDIEFETAVVGDDRFLLGGFARIPSPQGPTGSTPREYLLTGLENQADSLIAARNVPKATPLAANNQLLRTGTLDQTCTTLFWQLGLGKCDGGSARGSNVALLGPNMIYEENGRGMKWNAKDGASPLLPTLDWVISDGVNVLWATGGVLSMTQPSYDLIDLQGTAVPGQAGPRPLALGCGRILSRDNGSWWLRNIEKGTRWRIPDSRFPALGMGSLVMDCHSIIFQDGTRLLFKGLGEPETVP